MMIIFLSKHDWDSYQALEREPRAACGTEAGRGVRHVRARGEARAGEVPAEQDLAKRGGDRHSRPAWK